MGLENDDGNLPCRTSLVPPVACIELDHAVPEALAFSPRGLSCVDSMRHRSDLNLGLWGGAEVEEPRRMLRRPAIGCHDRKERAFSQVGKGRRVRLSGPSAGGRQQ
jgi:hypothetical protein